MAIKDQPPGTTDSSAASAKSRKIRLVCNSAFNLMGVVIPALVALACTPLLLRLLGPDLFGLLSIQLAVLVLLSVNDFGVSRAVVLVSIARGGFSDAGERLQTVRAGLHLVLLLSCAVLLLSFLFPALLWLSGPALSADTLLSWLLVGFASALALPTLPLRARLEIEERFASLNVLRSAGASLLFLAPLLAVWVEPTLVSAALGHLASRAVVLLAFGALGGSELLRGLTGQMRLLVAALPSLNSFPVHRELVARGSWLGIAGLVSMLIGYVDRFALGLLVGAAAVAPYAVAAELATKVWMVVGAMTAAATPQIAAGWKLQDASWHLPFRLLAWGVCLTVLAIHAVFSLLGAPLLQLWLGDGFRPEMVSLLAILSVGITINCASQMNYVILLIAGGERAAAKLQFLILPLTIIASLAAARIWGPVGVAWVFTARLALDSLAIRHLTSQRAGAARAGLSYPVLALMMAAAFFIHLASKAAA